MFDQKIPTWSFEIYCQFHRWFHNILNLEIFYSKWDDFEHVSALLHSTIHVFQKWSPLTFTATRGSDGPKSFLKRLALLYYRQLTHRWLMRPLAPAENPPRSCSCARWVTTESCLFRCSFVRVNIKGWA